MSDATLLALSAILEELRAIRTSLDLLTLQPENRPLARDIAALTARDEATGIEALTERFEALRASRVTFVSVADGRVHSMPRSADAETRFVSVATGEVHSLPAATAPESSSRSDREPPQAPSVPVGQSSATGPRASGA